MSRHNTDVRRTVTKNICKCIVIYPDRNVKEETKNVFGDYKDATALERRLNHSYPGHKFVIQDVTQERYKCVMRIRDYFENENTKKEKIQ